MKELPREATISCLPVTKTNFRNFLFFISVLFLFSGCTHHHVPSADTYDFDAIPEFTSQDTVTLINTQESTDDVLFATNMGHKWYGNLQQWTDVAIEIAAREMASRGMTVTDGAPKKLEMSIISVDTTTGGWGFSSHVTMKVVTGDGYTRTIISDGPSPLLNRAADAGIMRAVAAMFKDEKIMEYLTQ